jgi:hypothetical protein
LSHRLNDSLPPSITNAPGYFSQDVHHQLFEVRYHFANTPAFVRTAFRTYYDIAHTTAMDDYVIGNPSLHSHVPCCRMPATWDPRRTGKHHRVNAVAVAERSFRDDNYDLSDSQPASP